MPAGRPTKYDPKFCEMLIDHLAQGHSFESFGGLIEVDRSNIYEWVKIHPEFRDAKKIGRDKGLLTLERMAFQGMTGQISGWNPTTWIFFMKNMHRDLYNENQKIEISAKPTVIQRLDGSEVVLTLEEPKES